MVLKSSQCLEGSKILLNPISILPYRWESPQVPWETPHAQSPFPKLMESEAPKEGLGIIIFLLKYS